MDVSRVVIGNQVRKHIDEQGLAQVVASLYPADCLTCGRALGPSPWSLCVDDATAFAFASLHHRHCRTPEWTIGGPLIMASGGGVSFATKSLTLPFGPDNTTAQPLPILVVNPGLEMVWLGRDSAGRWRVQLAAQFTASGLAPAAPRVNLSQPAKGVVARLTRSTVAAVFEMAPHETYEAPADPGFQALARKFGGVMLVVTHALNPAELTMHNLTGQMTPVLDGDRSLSGWVKLT